jgi:MarR-like DNA-binding transcriptional regulator SgrR of sgrS sRNA
MTQRQAYYTFQELADRWRCSRGTVRNRLRAFGAPVLDFASAPGKRSKKAIPASVVEAVELKKTKRLAL